MLEAENQKEFEMTRNELGIKKYKIYAYLHNGIPYMSDWLDMKDESVANLGKVDWNWINSYRIDELNCNQNPYRCEFDGLHRTLYHTDVLVVKKSELKEMKKTSWDNGAFMKYNKKALEKMGVEK